MASTAAWESGDGSLFLIKHIDDGSTITYGPMPVPDGTGLDDLLIVQTCGRMISNWTVECYYTEPRKNPIDFNCAVKVAEIGANMEVLLMPDRMGKAGEQYFGISFNEIVNE